MQLNQDLGVRGSRYRSVTWNGFLISGINYTSWTRLSPCARVNKQIFVIACFGSGPNAVFLEVTKQTENTIQTLSLTTTKSGFKGVNQAWFAGSLTRFGLLDLRPFACFRQCHAISPSGNKKRDRRGEEKLRTGQGKRSACSKACGERTSPPGWGRGETHQKVEGAIQKVNNETKAQSGSRQASRPGFQLHFRPGLGTVTPNPRAAQGPLPRVTAKFRA